MGYIGTIASAILTSVGYLYGWPWLFISLIPMLMTAHKRANLLIWGVTYMGLNHLFLWQLHDDASLPLAGGVWLLTALYFGGFYGLGQWIIEAVLSLRWTGKIGIRQPLAGIPIWLMPLVFPLIEGMTSVGPYANTNGHLAIGLAPIIHHLPIYSVVGHIAMGGIIVLINLLMMMIIYKKSRLAMGMLLALIVGMTTISSPKASPIPGADLHVSVISTDVRQDIKMNPYHWPRLADMYLNLIKRATGNLIILPETILPTIIPNHPLYHDIQAHSQAHDVFILFGSFIQDTGLYNGSLLIQPTGPPVVYKKQRLMPFGESWPLIDWVRPLLSSFNLPRSFKQGTHHGDIAIRDHAIRPLICLEGIYGHMYATPHPSTVVVLANHAWFNQSSSDQRLQYLARIHAAEYGRYVLISSNNGQPTILSETGHNQWPQGPSPIATMTIPLVATTTIYHRYPWLGVLGLLLLIGVIRPILIKANAPVKPGPSQNNNAL